MQIIEVRSKRTHLGSLESKRLFIPVSALILFYLLHLQLYLYLLSLCINIGSFNTCAVILGKTENKLHTKNIQLSKYYLNTMLNILRIGVEKNAKRTFDCEVVCLRLFKRHPNDLFYTLTQ